MILSLYYLFLIILVQNKFPNKNFLMTSKFFKIVLSWHWMIWKWFLLLVYFNEVHSISRLTPRRISFHLQFMYTFEDWARALRLFHRTLHHVCNHSSPQCFRRWRPQHQLETSHKGLHWKVLVYFRSLHFPADVSRWRWRHSFPAFWRISFWIGSTFTLQRRNAETNFSCDAESTLLRHVHVFTTCNPTFPTSQKRRMRNERYKRCFGASSRLHVSWISRPFTFVSVTRIHNWKGWIDSFRHGLFSRKPFAMSTFVFWRFLWTLHRTRCWPIGCNKQKIWSAVKSRIHYTFGSFE